MKQIDRISSMGLQASDPAVAAVKQRYGIVGRAPALLAAIGRALQVAPIDLSVLVVGESGSGKEFFPKIIHSASPRKHSKYIAVNCGAIPEGTIDSELFGHEKGAFTGAVGSRKGYFEEADGGTIFLDEVAELPLTTQARLLRVLETGEFIKVGSSEVQRANLRVVAATNVDLPQAVLEGRFREDLYYRLSTVLINVPPLRDRGDDIVLLARKFASDFAERQMTAPIDLASSARDVLLRYRWPGNVRQLKNVIDQVALFRAGTLVEGDDLREFLPEAAMPYSIAAAPHGERAGYEHERRLLLNMVMSLKEEVEALREEVESMRSGAPRDVRSQPISSLLTPWREETEGREASAASAPGEEVAAPLSLEQSERETIERVLALHGGSRRDTAAALNISERTLYRKIREYGIE